ncbi:MAG TPA: hypothetical protein VK172_06015, partial [Lentimicrobium sp.]|nr:hypothetical protein [Lentimicrobium sp.]
MKPNHILLSRTDSIGDVILTLPLAGLLKHHFPGVKITFLGMPYTKDVIESCIHVDQFLDWSMLRSMNEKEAAELLKSCHADLIIHVFPRKEIARLAFKAHIPLRIGASGRLYHWWYCNKPVLLSRKNSHLHEAVLNICLAKPLFDKRIIAEYREGNPQLLSEFTGIQAPASAKANITGLIDNKYFNVIIHPKSKGSAREWGMDNYAYLAGKLSRISPLPGYKPYKIYISGTAEEGSILKESGFFEKTG